MIILGTNSIKDTGYNVANSLRFDDGSSDFLNATNSTPTNNDKCTLSVWIKRSALGGTKSIIGFHTDDNNRGNLVFDSDKLEVRIFDSGSTTTQLTTNQVFRDISAWYHIVLSVDTTQSTASSRVRIYVNGSEVTDFGTETNPSQNQNFGLNNSSVVLKIGQKGENNDYFDGYMAEVVFIDGQQLTPTSFGEFDEDSPNIWKPIDVSGLTFGTNGFYLDFEDSSALGNDVSGNNNDFTANNLTAVDQSTDTCTNNFATGNPIAAQAGSAQSDSLLTFSEGNLLMAANSETGIANFGLSKGKWFWEVKVITDQDGLIIGACNEHFNINAELGYNSPASASGAKVFGYYGGNGTATVTIDDGSGFSSYGSAIAVNNIVSVALDLDSADQSCTFYLNGSSQGALDITNLSSGESYFPAVGNWSVGDVSTSWNFGSPQYSESGGNSDGNGYGNFSMAVPSGYHAINTKNLAEYG
jgi:hypothetical protein